MPATLAPETTVRWSALEQTLATLLAPLDYPDWQTWQVAVHGRLLALTAADSLCVFTPLASGPAAWYAPHLSDAALGAYAAQAAADPGWDVIERGYATRGADVAHEDELMPRAAFERSPFFNEFLRPSRILDVVVAGAPFGGHVPARLHFSRETRRGGDWAAECATLVRAVLPAFRAGLGIWRQLGARRTELGHVLDALTDAVLLYESSGALVHANPAALQLLDEPVADRVRAAAQQLAWSVGATARRGGGSEPALREVRLDASRSLSLRATLAPTWMLGREPGILVTLEAAATRLPTDAELRERHGLTARELEVARLVAAGQSNKAIAAQLGLSFFTARNHVERLLAKLGASNRAHVGALLRGE
jgi:DNA-binding CsgD family transcriptional regulator/PAS domain-containing protein